MKSKAPGGYNLASGGAGFRSYSDRKIGCNKIIKFDMTTGKMVANIRESRGALQKELAGVINMNSVVLNRIEKDKRPARGDELKAIADYFDVSTDYLLGRDNLNRNTPLSNKQKKLLSGFDGLNEEGKKAIMVLIGQLSFARSQPKMTVAV